MAASDRPKARGCWSSNCRSTIGANGLRFDSHTTRAGVVCHAPKKSHHRSFHAGSVESYCALTRPHVALRTEGHRCDNAQVAVLRDLISLASEQWEPAVELAIFGTADSGDIAETIERWVTQRCGPIADALFYRPGVGVVVGLALERGTGIVVKVHRWNVSIDRLQAVHQVQSLLSDSDRCAPRPLVAPEPLAGGIATVEELRTGARADGRDPLVRRALAEGLHAFVKAAAPLVGMADVGPSILLRPHGAALWSEPHDVRFDFDATAQGAEWIDALATTARRRLTAQSSHTVIGHFDWRMQNLGFMGTELVAIYDWDSLAEAPEAVLVGCNAAQFTADWSGTELDPLPTIGEMRSFVEEYELARGKAFTDEEREILDAANLFLCAYGARCQHSDMVLHPELVRAPIPPWFRLLLERGEGALLDLR